MSIHEVFPYLRAKSAEEAVQFYKKAFGATEKFRLTEPGGRIGHVELLFGTATVMISDEFPELGIHALDPKGPSGFVLHLHVDDADAMIADAVKAGAQVVREAADQFYGERSGTIRDPFGYDWLIGHSIEALEPQEMQRRYHKMLARG
jgi:uncharacterized glyoxalase superfamily protein PhnB